MSVKEFNLDLQSFKPSADFLKNVEDQLIKLKLYGHIDDIQTKSRPIDKKTLVQVFNEKIDFAHDEDLEILVDIIDEGNDTVIGSLPLHTETYCVSQEHRIWSLDVIGANDTVIGTFNVGAKFSQEGEDNEAEQLSLTQDEKAILEKSFKNLSSGADMLNCGVISDAIDDLELNTDNVIQKILRQIDFTQGEIDFDQFVVLVSKALKEFESNLDVQTAHRFLSSDGANVTVEDLVKYGNTIKLNLSENDWRNLVMKIDSTDTGKVNQEDFTLAVLGDEHQ